MDEVCKWWTSVVGVAANWLIGDDSAAVKFYPVVDSFPKDLQDSRYVD